jgi:hypothetical protein
LKKNKHLFPDVKIKTKFNMDHSMEKQIEVLNPTNLKWIYLEKKSGNLKLKTKNIIKTFDTYGELLGMKHKFG